MMPSLPKRRSSFALLRSPSAESSSSTRSSFSKLSVASGGSKATERIDTIDVNAEALERFVILTLCDLVEDSKLMNRVVELVEDLAEHSVKSGGKLCNFSQQKTCPHCRPVRLAEIVSSLREVIEKTPSLPAHVTAEVHTMIGLLRQKLGDFEGAIQSFTKVMWIQSSLVLGSSSSTLLSPLSDMSSSSLSWSNKNEAESDTTAAAGGCSADWTLAMTKHRLGMAYGRNGEFNNAINLLEKAIEDYERCSAAGCTTKNSRKLVVQARTALSSYTEAKILEAFIATGNKNSRGRRESSIVARASKSFTKGNSNLPNNTPQSSPVRRPIPRRSITTDNSEAFGVDAIRRRASMHGL